MWVSQCSSPRSSQSKRTWTTPQGPPLRRHVLSVVLVLLWTAMGANLSWRKGKYGQRIDWIGTTITVCPHLGFSAVWIEIHQHKAAETLALTERHSLSLGSSAGPAVSSRGLRLLTRRSGSPS